MFCSSVAISVEPKIFLPISLPYIVAIALIFIVSYDHAVGSGESIEFFVVYAIYVVLVILLESVLEPQLTCQSHARSCRKSRYRE